MKLIAVIFASTLILSTAGAFAEDVVPELNLSWAIKIQKQVDALSLTMANDVRIPTGTIVAFYGDPAPAGWMLCDGSTIPTQFVELRKLVGNSVPDLRGAFLRGLNRNGKGLDPDNDRKLGSSQPDTFRKHNHPGYVYDMGTKPALVQGPGVNYGAGTNPPTGPTDVGAGAGDETRPKNIAVNFIIKI